MVTFFTWFLIVGLIAVGVGLLVGQAMYFDGGQDLDPNDPFQITPAERVDRLRQNTDDGLDD